jgi:hypothetical protein
MPIKWQKNCLGAVLTDQAAKNSGGNVISVKIRKTKERPSTPIANERLYCGIKLKLLINW